MDWKTIRTVGGIGSILAIVPYVNVVGWILVVVALYEISQQTDNKNIFNYYLISVIIKFVGFLLFIFGFFSVAFITAAVHPNEVANYFGLIFAAITFAAILIVSAYFVNKSFIEVSEETGIDTFKTAGKFIFWGAVTAIIGIGIILYLVGYVMQIISFFALPEDFLLEKPDHNFSGETYKKEN